jgi:hypothetical protein
MTGCQGQDWASYQDYTPDTSGIAFAIIKQTEGLTYVNPKATSQVQHARAGGLVVGHSHYPHMANNAATEADRFLAAARPQPGDIVVLDWEGYDQANRDVPWTRQVAYKGAFLARLRAAAPTRQRLTYCNTDYLARDPDGEYGDGLWIATAGHPAGEPGIDHQWLIHQYSTAGGIDRDYCPLSPAELHAWAHAKEDHMPLTADDKTWIQGVINTAVKAAVDDIAKEAAHQVAIYQWDSPTTGKPNMLGSYLAAGEKQTADILAAVKAAAPTLSADQVKALAAAVAPAVGSAIAADLAKRLQA